MIEKLFSSKVLFQVLAFLFQNEKETLSTTEIIKATGKNQANVLRELEKLVKWDIVQKTKRGNQNFYKLNKSYPFFKELKILFNKYQAQSQKFLLYTEEGNPALLSLDYFSRAYADDLPVRLGILNQLPNLLSHFKNNYVWFYFAKKDVLKSTEESLKKLLTDASFVKKLIYEPTVKKGEEALKIFKKIQKGNYKVTKKETLAYLDKFQEIITEQIGRNFIAIFDLFNAPYSNYLKKYLEKKTRGTSLRLNYVLEKLLTPEPLTWTQLYRIELIKLAQDYKKKKVGFKKRLKKIYEDWKWLNYGYRGPVFSYEYFEQIFDELAKKGLKSLEKELNSILNNEKDARCEKNKIFRKLKIDQKHQGFINALSLLSYLKVYRKDTAFLLIYLTNRIVEQFAGNIKRDNWLYLTLDEARDLIGGKLKTKRDEMIAREKNSVYIAQGLILLVGEEADKFIAENTEEGIGVKSGEVKLLEGTTACLGKTGDWVYGKVRTVNSEEDMRKMEKGDILVSFATTPDILPAMKRASAIVTDQGGITSHAAIVSRELNTPCLIGTRYATKVFKDGDKVVVCPRHGYIKFQ